MLLIRKGKEPTSLTRYKCQEHSYYGGIPDETKNEIRNSLLAEQGNLCAYCMRRISIINMKIEHWQSQRSLDDYGSLNYKNLLGCCLGLTKGKSGKKYETCDTHKGEENITVDPRNENHIKLIKYKSSDGTIYSDNWDINNDIDKKLNLNNEYSMLKENRKAKLDVLYEHLSKANKTGDLNKSFLRKLLLKYTTVDEEGELPEYSGIILWRLRKIKGYPFI